ncbi:MAG: hypothetical protein IJ333_08515 [Clostridia bacterium]|nr:hypothetical protein [Clostridia bacterium]
MSYNVDNNFNRRDYDENCCKSIYYHWYGCWLLVYFAPDFRWSCFEKTATTKSELTVNAILVLLFCNVIGGILMLCMKDEDLAPVAQ